MTNFKDTLADYLFIDITESIELLTDREFEGSETDVEKLIREEIKAALNRIADGIDLILEDSKVS